MFFAMPRRSRRLVSVYCAFWDDYDMAINMSPARRLTILTSTVHTNRDGPAEEPRAELGDGCKCRMSGSINRCSFFLSNTTRNGRRSIESKEMQLASALIGNTTRTTKCTAQKLIESCGEWPMCQLMRVWTW